MNKQIFLILAVIAVAACVQGGGPSGGTGTLQLKVTDLAGENLSSLVLTVSKIDVHLAGNDTSIEAPINQTNLGSENNDTSTADWVTVFSGTKTVDLVDVKSIWDILSEGSLAAGRYTQIRLFVTSATAVIDGVSTTVKVPSNTIKFVHTFVVDDGKVTSLVIDFDADRSVVKRDSSYILKPVVRIMTEFRGKTPSEADTIKSQQAAYAAQVRAQRSQGKTGGGSRLQGTTTFQGGVSITLTSPVGGESWTAGSTHTLSWSSTGVAHYQLWYTTNSALTCGGGGWTLLQSHPYSPTTYDWTLPNLNSDTVRVRVEGHTSSHATLGFTCSGEFSVH